MTDLQSDSQETASAPGGSSYDELLKSLVDVGKRAFDPSEPIESREVGRALFDDLVQKAATIVIIPALNTLIVPGRVPEWLRQRFVDVLAAAPLRRYGVRAALEFVFAVHPSTAAGPGGIGEAPGRQGASITQQAIATASTLLATPPASISPETWFSGIAPQLLELLDGRDGLGLTKTAAYVVGFGILGRRQFGAPGTPGWTHSVEPILRLIKPDTKRIEECLLQDSAEVHGIVDLSKPTVVVTTATDLATALRRLQSLVISHPNPGLSRRLLRPLLLALWSLSSKRTPGTHDEDDYGRPAKNLLTIFLKVANSLDPVMALIDGLLYHGEHSGDRALWSFDVAPDGGVQIVAPRKTQGYSPVDQIDLVEIDRKTQILLELLASIYSDEEVAAIFLDLFDQWLSSGDKQKKQSILITRPSDEGSATPLQLLLQGQVLQAMMQKFQDKLAGQPGHILQLVDRLLSEQSQLSNDAEVTSVALSLLSSIAYTPNFQRGKVDKSLMQSIQDSLNRISRGGDDDTSTTARNLVLFLEYQDEIEPATTTDALPASSTDRRVEDRKTYTLAVSYITQRDSPPPVRSEGLNLIQGLIVANSPILDVPGILVLLSSVLAENEDYINLRVIKIYSQLARKHPGSVTKELVDRYVDSTETASVDTRLRFGEALLQVVEGLGETFAGDAAEQVCHALLLIAGRRAHRPKSEAKQERDEKLRRLKVERGEDAGEDEHEEEEEEDMTERQKLDNAILARIVEGWGSRRGDEDVRVRGSALSILAVAMETNILGIGLDLVSAGVDLSMQVLTLETTAEKGILRRAAVLVVLSFVRALDAARRAKRRLGFGLTEESRGNITRILEYVADVDDDGLVKQHARDVLESLENWTLTRLLPDADARGTPAALEDLAGLPGIRVGGLGDGRPGVRTAVIEEIE